MAQGFILGSSISTEAAVTFSIVSAIPDVIGWAEKQYTGRLDAWDWYVKAHKIHLWQVFLPPYLLHVIVDKLTHRQEEPYGWNELAIPLEMLCWAGEVFYFLNRLKS